MNGNHSHGVHNGNEEVVLLGTSTPLTARHRLADARKEKGLSCFDLARRLGLTVEEVRLQEEAADVSISTLNQWAAALRVPVTELVVEPEEWLHATHLLRAQAERLMRLAARLRDRSRRRSIQRLAQTFVDQLTEMHPALSSFSTGNNHRPKRTSPSRSRTNGLRVGRKHRQPPK